MNVLITGASGALGAAVIQEFVRRGAQVTGVGRAWPEPRPPIRTLELDLFDPAQVATLGDGFDVLVHVLGGFGGGQPVQDTSDATWAGQLEINLTAAFYAARAVLPGMLARGRGRIVAVGSKAALEPMPRFTAYAVSKAALVALIRGIAAETKASGVTANVVLPSTMDTPANRKAMPDADFAKWVKPESVAAVIGWLASPEAADVTGAVIPVYGGS
jgi:NAD(P)-dependent dehydrogenase (short-subunit alcohol dehydrogenase family)